VKTFNVPQQAYPAGVIIQNLPATLNNRFAAVGLTFTRVAWPAGIDYTKADDTVDANVVLVARIEFTTDNGQTWKLVGEAPFVGGVRFDRSGNEILTSSCEFRFASAGVPTTVFGGLRAWFNVLVPLTTALTARALEETDL
jgi:hypothetical protein